MSGINATERVRGELRPGESLLYSGREHYSVGYGIILMLLGAPSIAMSVIFITTLGSKSGEDFWGGLFLLILIGGIGLWALIKGYYFGFIADKNYHFISDQRLCIRGKTLLGKVLNRDIPAASIENASIKTEHYKKGSRRYILVKIKEEEKPVLLYPFPLEVDATMEALQKIVKISSQGR